MQEKQTYMFEEGTAELQRALIKKHDMCHPLDTQRCNNFGKVLYVCNIIGSLKQGAAG